MWWWLLNVALAGKLSEGYRGISFGSDTVLAVAPSDDCTQLPAQGVPWECRQKIGEASVVAAYLSEEGIFHAVHITAPSLSDSQALMNVLKAAYGPGIKMKSYQTGILPDWMWHDRDVVASFKFNQFSGFGTLTIFSKEKLSEVETAKAAKAAASINDL